MKIGYAKWTINNTLILGILWTLIGGFRFYEYLQYGETAWYNVFFMFLGPLYLGHYFYQRGMKYLTFDDERILVYNFLPKLIWLTDLREVKFVAADYHFISKSGKKIVINKESLDQKMVEEFDRKFFDLKHKLESKTVQENARTVSS